MWNRILCLIFGHDWKYYSGHTFPQVEFEYKKCDRCGDGNVDRIFEKE